MTQRVLSKVSRWGILLVLSLIAAIAIYPIAFMGLSSFKTSFEYLADPLSWPTGFSYVDNFVAVYYRFDLPRLLFAEPNPAPIKHWLWRAGLIDSPEVRLPMTGVSAGLAARIDQRLAAVSG